MSFEREQPQHPTSLPLVGRREIAGKAGVYVQDIDKWIRKYDDFPKPVAEPSMGANKVFKVWWWPAVKQWLIDNDRRYNEDWTAEDVNPHAQKVDRRRLTTKR